MKNYYIIHGFMGSNIENWFPWFKEQIDSDNSLCVIPQFPIELDKHNYNEWKKLLDVYYKEFNMINNESVIIGHSTGSICALKYVLENKIKIDKLILVSGFNNYLTPDENDIHNKINPTYYVDENEIKEIKKYANEIICIYGDDDPYIPQDVFHKFAESIDAKEVIIKNGGHLNTDSGYTEFTELLKYV